MDFFYGTSSGNSSRVAFALHEAKVEYVPHALHVPRGETRTPDYLALNPNGKVPTLVDDGFVVFESTAICEYLEDKFPSPSILPGDPQARARARMWNQYADTRVAPA